MNNPKLAKKKDCTGCGLCIEICKKDAIGFVSDELGFLYPEVNNELCVSCGLCTKYCPILDNVETNCFSSSFYGWTTNNEQRKNSTSGGIATALAHHIVDNNGDVIGAGFDDEFHLKHIVVNNIDGLNKLRGSKYIQSELSEIYPIIKTNCISGKLAERTL